MIDASLPAGDSNRTFSEVVLALMKGPLYRDGHERAWHDLLVLRGPVADYVAVMGLAVYVDENEGFAFLRTTPDVDGEESLPRLVQRRKLSFPLSLLLALLRGRLVDHDAAGGGTKAVMTREQIASMLRVFLPEGSNDARIFDQIDTHIKKATELGFLRQVRGDETTYEIRRILAAFVDAQWLADFDVRLAEYAARLEEIA